MVHTVLAENRDLLLEKHSKKAERFPELFRREEEGVGHLFWISHPKIYLLN